MAGPIERVVDAHVHHWDPARKDFFGFLADEAALRTMTGLSDVSPLRRRYDRSVYLSEAPPWNVAKYVHVSAAMGPAVSFAAETAERQADTDRDGQPDAIVGSVHGTASPKEIVTQLVEQTTADRFRGVRVNLGIDHTGESAHALLTELQDRDLTYEMWIHPEGMADAAEVIAHFDRLPVVVGHMGWPLNEDGDHMQLWTDGLQRLAAVGPRVHCKLSGIVQMLRRLDVSAMKPWIDTAIDIFGDDRCFFASNFPVDGAQGSFAELFAAYDAVTADRDDAARARLFADNAQRFYRI